VPLNRQVLLQFIGAMNAIRGVAIKSGAANAAWELQEAVNRSCIILAGVPSSRRLGSTEQAVHADACAAMLSVVSPVVQKMFGKVLGCSSRALTCKDNG
jgi:hypothetical protein